MTSKSTKKGKKQLETVMTLYEKVDIDSLQKLISADTLDEKLRAQLKLYYGKRTDKNIIPVRYHFSQKLEEFGRLYAEKSLSLQNLKRNIRHCLARDYYYDIDIDNCHPVLISQYCEKNNIECPNLDIYVKSREEVLKKIMNHHKMTRDEAKNLVLRLCYLGKYEVIKEKDGEPLIYIPKFKVKFLERFKAEMTKIAEAVSEIEVETTELVEKDKTKLNKKACILSITAQKLEHTCLMAMYDYFTKQGLKIGALCFDGLLLEKDDKIKSLIETINKCAKYVKSKTDYEITLSSKKMDTELNHILPQFSAYVSDDLECQTKLFQIEGANKFKYCGGQLYIFNENTGMYDTHISTLNNYLIKNRRYLHIITRQATEKTPEVVESYGSASHLLKRVVPFIEAGSVDEEWLERTQNTSIGHLLFKDGIYNMDTAEFTKGFDPNIVFHKRIPWNFPEYNEKEIKKAYDISFGALFEDPKPMMISLACALAGDTHIKRFYMCPGKSNAGKSKLATMLQYAFGEYVGNFNAESLAYTSNMDSKDEAQKNRWALLSRFCRILLSNEMNMKKKLNGNDIKKFASGGDKIVGRTHGKEEVSFKPHYTLFCMFNDLPTIEPRDKAVENRLTFIDFPYVFVNKSEKDEKTYYKIKDDKLDSKIETEEFARGFIHILLDAYKEYQENGLPEFDEKIKDKWSTEGKQSNEIIELIKEHYEITEDKNDKVTIGDLKKFRESHKDVFATISGPRFNDILTEELNLEQGRDAKSGFWKGIKKIDKLNVDFN